MIALELTLGPLRASLRLGAPDPPAPLEQPDTPDPEPEERDERPASSERPDLEAAPGGLQELGPSAFGFSAPRWSSLAGDAPDP